MDEPSDDIFAISPPHSTRRRSMFITMYRASECHGALGIRSDETVTLATDCTDRWRCAWWASSSGRIRSFTGLVERIAVAAVADPFFAEEIVRDLAGRGVLTGGRGDYRLMGDVDEIGVRPRYRRCSRPASIGCQLKRKLDLNAAAVIGTHFDVDALQALLPDAVPSIGRLSVGRVD